MGKPLDPKKIKSAKRVLEVFEYFNASRPQATVMEIAREYGYPQSSTSELLSCLVELGFLHRDRNSRTYRPTARVAMLGSWVLPGLFRQGKLLPMMDELAEEIRGTVVLGGIVGLRLHYFQTVVGPDAHPSEGVAGSLLHTAMGKLLLSTYDRQYVRKVVHRLNAEGAPESWVRWRELLTEIEQIRRQGYAIDAWSDGESGMCAVILSHTPAEPLTLGIAVEPGDERGSDFFVSALRNAISNHFGPSPARPAAQAHGFSSGHKGPLYAESILAN